MSKSITLKNPATAAAPLSNPARWALASLCLATLMPSLDTSIANAGLPVLAQALGASFHAVQWVVLAYLLAITTLIVSVGRLGDMVGRRRLLLIGLSIFTAASLLCGVAPTLGLLIAARALQGLGAAMMLALTVAFVGDTVPKPRAGRAMGLLGAMSALGTTLGPSLGGLLMAGVSWRAIFLINVPLGLLNIALARRYLPADAPRIRTGASFDKIGTFVLALTLAAYALAMTLSPEFRWVLLLLMMLGLGLFVWVETHVASPLIDLAMLRIPGFAAGLLTSLVVALVMMTTLVVGPFYLSHGLGLGTAAVGLTLSIGPLTAALTGVPAGRLVDRMSPGTMLRLGLVTMAAGTSLLAVQPAGSGVVVYVALIMITTIGYALFQAANNTAVMANVGANQRGLASGMLSLARNLGFITGASAMGAVFAAAAKTSDITSASPEAVASGMRWTFAVAAAALLGAICVAFAGRRSPRT